MTKLGLGQVLEWITGLYSGYFNERARLILLALYNYICLINAVDYKFRCLTR
jgi:hypothetical protein